MKIQLQNQPKASAFTDLGIWFASHEQYECAVNAFATSLQMEPDQPDAAHVVFMFGVSLYFSGNAKDGIASLQEAERLGYRDIKLHLILAEAFDQSHSLDDADKEWRAALELDPQSAIALEGLSSHLIAGGDYAGTIALLENPHLLAQRTPQQSVNLALAYAKTTKPDEAVRVLRDGLHASPDSLIIADELAAVLVQLNRQEEALAVLDLAHAEHPDNLDAAIHYLEMLMTVHPEKAPEAGSKLLLLFPQSWRLLYLNGVLETKSGNLESAPHSSGAIVSPQAGRSKVS